MKKCTLLFFIIGIVLFAAGDWYCSQCGHANPEYETKCNFCGKPK